MEDLIRQMMGGAEAPQAKQQSGGDPLSDLLRGILGGVTPQQSGGATPQQGASAGGLGDILGSILGGADGKLDAGDLAGILGGILGGGTSTPQGSRGATGTGGLGDILGAILGSGGTNVGANSFLAPIVMSLAEKLGLSPAMAQAVVAFVLAKLLPGASSTARAQAAPKAAPKRSQPQTQQPKGLDLDYLLDTMGKGEAPDASYLRSTGMADELAQQTGMDQNTAVQSLQQVFSLLGGQLGEGRSGTQPGPAKKSELDGLLDTWDR
jgi:hypothetical protein